MERLPAAAARPLAPLLTLTLTLALAGSVPSTASAADCPAVPGLAPLLEPGTVLLLGELHGTEQVPALVGTVACHALAAELPVTVGLELPVSERERVAAFLASDGGADAEAALLAGPLWQAELQYGVASRAVVDLLDDLRAVKAAGADLRVLLYDPGRVPERDRGMAEILAKALGEAPDGFAVVLSGNYHNRLTVGTGFDPELEPMGHLLAKKLTDRRIVSLDIAHPGGTAWLCFGSKPEDCGVKEVEGDAERSGGIEIRDRGADDPFDGRYFTGPLTASPPAVHPDGGG